MPKYRFVFDDGTKPSQSDLLELPSIAAAKSQAVVYAGDMLRDADGAFWEDSSWRLDVTDEFGLILCTILVQGVEAAAITVVGAST